MQCMNDLTNELIIDTVFKRLAMSEEFDLKRIGHDFSNFSQRKPPSEVTAADLLYNLKWPLPMNREVHYGY